MLEKSCLSLKCRSGKPTNSQVYLTVYWWTWVENWTATATQTVASFDKFSRPER